MSVHTKTLSRLKQSINHERRKEYNTPWDQNESAQDVGLVPVRPAASSVVSHPPAQAQTTRAMIVHFSYLLSEAHARHTTIAQHPCHQMVRTVSAAVAVAALLAVVAVALVAGVSEIAFSFPPETH